MSDISLSWRKEYARYWALKEIRGIPNRLLPPCGSIQNGISDISSSDILSNTNIVNDYLNTLHDQSLVLHDTEQQTIPPEYLWYQDFSEELLNMDVLIQYSTKYFSLSAFAQDFSTQSVIVLHPTSTIFSTRNQSPLMKCYNDRSSTIQCIKLSYNSNSENMEKGTRITQALPYMLAILCAEYFDGDIQALEAIEEASSCLESTWNHPVLTEILKCHCTKLWSIRLSRIIISKIQKLQCLAHTPELQILITTAWHRACYTLSNLPCIATFPYGSWYNLQFAVLRLYSVGWYIAGLGISVQLIDDIKTNLVSSLIAYIQNNQCDKTACIYSCLTGESLTISLQLVDCIRNSIPPTNDIFLASLLNTILPWWFNYRTSDPILQYASYNSSPSIYSTSSSKKEENLVDDDLLTRMKLRHIYAISLIEASVSLSSPILPIVNETGSSGKAIQTVTSALYGKPYEFIDIEDKLMEEVIQMCKYSVTNTSESEEFFKRAINYYWKPTNIFKLSTLTYKMARENEIRNSAIALGYLSFSSNTHIKYFQCEENLARDFLEIYNDIDSDMEEEVMKAVKQLSLKALCSEITELGCWPYGHYNLYDLWTDEGDDSADLIAPKSMLSFNTVYEKIACSRWCRQAASGICSLYGRFQNNNEYYIEISPSMSAIRTWHNLKYLIQCKIKNSGYCTDLLGRCLKESVVSKIPSELVSGWICGISGLLTTCSKDILTFARYVDDPQSLSSLATSVRKDIIHKSRAKIYEEHIRKVEESEKVKTDELFFAGTGKANKRSKSHTNKCNKLIPKKGGFPVGPAAIVAPSFQRSQEIAKALNKVITTKMKTVWLCSPYTWHNLLHSLSSLSNVITPGKYKSLQAPHDWRVLKALLSRPILYKLSDNNDNISYMNLYPPHKYTLDTTSLSVPLNVQNNLDASINLLEATKIVKSHSPLELMWSDVLKPNTRVSMSPDQLPKGLKKNLSGCAVFEQTGLLGEEICAAIAPCVSMMYDFIRKAPLIGGNIQIENAISELKSREYNILGPQCGACIEAVFRTQCPSLMQLDLDKTCRECVAVPLPGGSMPVTQIFFDYPHGIPIDNGDRIIPSLTSSDGDDRVRIALYAGFFSSTELCEIASKLAIGEWSGAPEVTCGVCSEVILAILSGFIIYQSGALKNIASYIALENKTLPCTTSPGRWAPCSARLNIEKNLSNNYVKTSLIKYPFRYAYHQSLSYDINSKPLHILPYDIDSLNDEQLEAIKQRSKVINTNWQIIDAKSHPLTNCISRHSLWVAEIELSRSLRIFWFRRYVSLFRLSQGSILKILYPCETVTEKTRLFKVLLGIPLQEAETGITFTNRSVENEITRLHDGLEACGISILVRLGMIVLAWIYAGAVQRIPCWSHGTREKPYLTERALCAIRQSRIIDEGNLLFDAQAEIGIADLDLDCRVEDTEQRNILAKWILNIVDTFDTNNLNEWHEYIAQKVKEIWVNSPSIQFFLSDISELYESISEVIDIESSILLYLLRSRSQLFLANEQYRQ